MASKSIVSLLLITMIVMTTMPKTYGTFEPCKTECHKQCLNVKEFKSKFCGQTCSLVCKNGGGSGGNFANLFGGGFSTGGQ